MTPRGADGPSRHVLMVADPFPPQVSGGNARLLRFVRFLPAFGWAVTVLAARTPGDAAVPADLRVERAAAPGLESLYRAARSLHRRAAGSQSGAAQSRPPARREAPPGHAPGRSSRRGLVNDWLAVPDERAGWIGPALRLGRRLLREESYDALLSSFPRPSAQVVASVLARESGLPWIADYRDPWATRHLRRYPTPVHRTAHYALEDWTLRPAAAVTATNRPIADSLRERFPALSDRVYVLPNGYDPTGAPAAVPPMGDGLWLVHTGRLYGRTEQSRRLLQAFATLPPHVHLLFVGVEGGELRRTADELGVADRVHTVPFVPHAQALGYQQAADGLVLITGNAPEALSSKVFEYLAAGRPIFAFIPAGSAADRLLEASGGSVRAYQSDTPRAALHEFVEMVEREGLEPPDAAVVAGYDGRVLTRRLAGYLDCLTEQATARVHER